MTVSVTPVLGCKPDMQKKKKKVNNNDSVVGCPQLVAVDADVYYFMHFLNESKCNFLSHLLLDFPQRTLSSIILNNRSENFIFFLK